MTTSHLQVLLGQLVLQQGRALLIIAGVGRCGLHTAARFVDVRGRRRLPTLIDDPILVHELPVRRILISGHFRCHVAHGAQASRIVQADVVHVACTLRIVLMLLLLNQDVVEVSCVVLGRLLSPIREGALQGRLVLQHSITSESSDVHPNTTHSILHA